MLIYKEDRHAALAAQSAVNATWRVVPSGLPHHLGVKIIRTIVFLSARRPGPHSY